MTEPRCDFLLQYSCHKLEVRQQAEPVEIRGPSTHYLKKGIRGRPLSRYMRPKIDDRKFCAKAGARLTFYQDCVRGYAASDFDIAVANCLRAKICHRVMKISRIESSCRQVSSPGKSHLVDFATVSTSPACVFIAKAGRKAARN
ncbi:hypothetical protein SprV_0200658400 [Sparganum proliferum]